MALNDKIKQLLTEINLTPSIFADEIGVQRSSISHILSGRNRPSLDIVQKIVKRYPHLGVEWILDDELDTVEPETKSRYKPAETTPNGPAIKPYQTALDLNEIASPGAATTQQNLSGSVSAEQKSIERILVFFSDGTFKEYTAS